MRTPFLRRVPTPSDADRPCIVQIGLIWEDFVSFRHIRTLNNVKKRQFIVITSIEDLAWVLIDRIAHLACYRLLSQSIFPSILTHSNFSSLYGSFAVNFLLIYIYIYI
jgi:hypothetical protein